MKKRFLATLAVGAFLVGMSGIANALSITPTDCGTTYTCWSGTVPANPTHPVDIKAITSSTSDLVTLYKAEVDTGEDGTAPFADMYETLFYNEIDDPTDATIRYVSGSVMDADFLLIKDGQKVAPYWYVFDVSSWNGTDPIEITGFWPDQGAISHVSLYGGGDTTVPEPATMLLFGTGLVGLAGAGRKKFKK